MRQFVKIIIKLAFAVSATFGFYSCKADFESVNKNPYLIDEELARRDGYNQGSDFIVLQKECIPVQENRFQFSEHMVGFPYGRYLPPTNSWGGQNFFTFNPSPSWNNAPYNDCFSNFYPSFFKIQKNTGEEGVNYAWAKILRVASMHRMTDIYGPIPYSKVRFGQLSAEYDSQEEVYELMIKELTESSDILAKYVAASGNAKPMADFDIVFAGDFSKWVKFANTLKLRLAVRMSYIAPDKAKKYAEEAVAAGVLENKDDRVEVETNGKNPIFIVSKWPELRASAEMVSYLKGYSDPRLPKYLKKHNGSGDYLGMRVGLLNMNRDVMSAMFSEPNVEENTPLLWMPVAEAYFLRAEGAIRNWDMKGAAEELYNKGIKASFEEWGAEGADTYINDAYSTQANYYDPQGINSASALSSITIKWDESAVFEEKLERIITQKWIALYPLGMEAWAEYRRTGYPKFFPVVNNLSSDGVNSTDGARRLKFPQSEYDNNKANVLKAVGLLNGSDTQITKLWWDAK